MTQHAGDPQGAPTSKTSRVNDARQDILDDRRKNAPALPSCPICEGKTQVVYNRNNQQVIVCTDCRSGVTVPGSAWGIARDKKQAR